MIYVMRGTRYQNDGEKPSEDCLILEAHNVGLAFHAAKDSGLCYPKVVLKTRSKKAANAARDNVLKYVRIQKTADK